MKKWTKIMAAVLSFVIIASAITGGVVLADEPEDGTTVTPPPRAQFAARLHISSDLSDLLGLSLAEIQEQRQAGASLVEIAAAQGVSEDALIAALIGPVAERLTQAVTDGKMTQDQADTILANIITRTTKMVNSSEIGPVAGERPAIGTIRERLADREITPFQRGFKAGLQCADLSDLLGLSLAEIQQQRQDGASLVEIAAAQGVSEDALIAALTANEAERLAQAVTDGKITQEQADEIMAKIVERTTEMVNSTEVGPTLGARPEMGQRGGFGTANADTNDVTPRFGGRMGGNFDGSPRGMVADGMSA